MTQIIGRPGRYSRTQGNANSRRAWAWKLLAWPAGAVSVLYLVLGGLSYVEHRGGVAELLAGAVFGWVWLAGARKSASAQTHATRQQHGTGAEEEVVAALQAAGVTLVINGAELHAGGDADHVVAHLRGDGTGVLAVVETKAGGGTIRMAGRTILSGKAGRAIPGDPIAQALRQADALTRMTHRQAVAVVCIPWMTNEPFAAFGAIVCGKRHLHQLFSRTLPATRLDARDLQMIQTSVRPKS